MWAYVREPPSEYPKYYNCSESKQPVGRECVNVLHDIQ